MFLSYECLYIGQDKKTKKSHWQYKITDSDFEEVGIEVEAWTVGVSASVAGTVIDAYEKRNLNVAANLMKAIVWYSKTYNRTIPDIISRNKKYNTKFAKYEKELEKYMVLI